jgi:tetratricopeptide (TPR) repeat protein
VVIILVAALAVRLLHDRGQSGASSPIASSQSPLDEGIRLHAQHRLEDASHAFEQAAATHPSDPVPLNWLGTIAVEEDHTEQALDYFHRSLEINPNDADIWRACGQLFQRRGDSAAAVRAFTHAVQINPKDAAALAGLGMAERGRNLRARGLADLIRAGQMDPANVRIQTDLGSAALDDGKLALAQKSYAAAIALKPQDPLALLGTARVSMQMDPSPTTLAHAREQIDAAMSDGGDFATAYLARGQWNLLEKQYPDAVKDLNEALAKDAMLSTAHAYLSQAYAAMGKPALARDESAKYLKAYAGEKSAQQALTGEHAPAH